MTFQSTRMHLLTLFLAALAANAPLAAQEDATLPEAEALLDARDARLAPEGVQAALRGMVLEGRATFEGVEATGGFRELYGAGGRTWFELVVPELGAFVQGCDGEHAWDEDPRRGPRLGAEPVLRQALVRHALQAGRPWRELYTSATARSLERIEGREVVRIELEAGKQADTETWYVDPEELLLVRHVLRRQTAEGVYDVSTTYGDWRPIDGVPIAHRRVTRAGPQLIVREVEKVRLGLELSGEEFELPAALGAWLEAREQLPREPEVIERGEQLVLATRASTRPGEFGDMRTRMMVALTKHLVANDVQRSGPYYVRYLGFGEDRIDLECGVHVPRELPPGEGVSTLTLPAGPALTVLHEGGYDSLPAVYQALERTLQARGLVRTGPHMELFWVDDVLEADPLLWHTEVVIPVGEREDG